MIKKTGAGRPTKSVKATQRVVLTLTEAEKELALEMAENAGIKQLAKWFKIQAGIART